MRSRILVGALALCLAVAAFAQDYDTVPRDGLVAEYLLDGNCDDTSGNGLHGDDNGLYGAVDRFGRSDGAMEFDGYSWMTVPDDDAFDFGTGAFSVAVWVKGDTDLGTDNDDYFVGRYENDSVPGWALKERDGGSALLTTDSDSNWEQTFVSTLVDDGSWHFVVATRDWDGEKSIYIDGELVEQYAADCKDVSNDLDLLVGRNPMGDVNMTGYLDDLRIYDRLLSGSEVLALYGSAGSAAIPRDGLVAEWLLDGDCYDTSGNGLDGDDNGLYPAADRFGNQGGAMEFDGYSWMTVPDDDSFDFGYDAFTVAFWIKAPLDVGTDQDDYIVSKYVDDATSGWTVKERDGGIALLSNGGDYDWEQTFVSTLIDDDEWHSVVVVREDDGTKSIYIDGEQVESYAADSQYLDNDSDLFIGHNPKDDVNITGVLDEVRIWNRALDSAEIAAVSGGGGAVAYEEGGLVAEYLLDGNADDNSGNGLDGVNKGAKAAQNRFGQNGKAMDFNGNAYIYVPDDDRLDFGTGPFSVAFWVRGRTDLGTDSDDYLVSKYVSDSTPGWSVKERDGGPALLTTDAEGDWEQTFSETLVDNNKWNFVVATRARDGTKSIWINGEEILNYYADPKDVSNDEDLFIARDGMDEYNATCRLDDIRIYDKCLSEDEIYELYNEGK
jgi:hypothetical protein